MKIVSLVKPSVITLNHPKHLDLLNSNYQSLEMPNNKGNEVKGNVEKLKKNNWKMWLNVNEYKVYTKERDQSLNMFSKKVI